MWFANSTPDRQKRASRANPELRQQVLAASPIPPAKPFELLTLTELFEGGDRTLVFDVESYPNYFLVSFKCLRTGKVIYFEDSPEAEINVKILSFILHRFLIVGFNSRNYDLPVVLVALQGAKAATLFRITQEIINEGMQPYEVALKYNVKPAKVNHIDLIEVAPLQASLKLYAGRLHCPRMQDLPYDIHKELTPLEAWNVLHYNVNDLDNTALLYEFQLPHIALRESLGRQYNQDLRSKSDAQVAEAIIEGELSKLGIDTKAPDVPVGRRFNYTPPAHVAFRTPLLQATLERVRSMDFEVGHNGQVIAPDAMSALRLALGGCVYQMGMGGLHSTEESMAHVADANTIICDVDVAGYYPRIILTEKLFPPHLGPGFLQAFETIVNRRLGAKARVKELKKFDIKTPDIEAQIIIYIAEDGGLKIAINGTFGKTGNQFSIVFSPEMLVQICLSGQLNLLMLIEDIELAGIPVVSANTDGIVIKCPKDRYDDLVAIIKAWEAATGFETEETRYRGIYSRDINNYIAVKEDGTCKTKGTYCDKGSAQGSVLSKNPEHYICSMAVQAYLADGVPLAHTIDGCRDIRQFVSVRQVKGGAQKDGTYLGKAIRWYYAQGETGTINYVLSGNKVPKSDGARPLMDLPAELPADLDFDRYLAIATDMLFDLGVYKRPGTATLF
jgi:hypothetical protein